jgi:PilZ domain-containing protein
MTLEAVAERLNPAVSDGTAHTPTLIEQPDRPVLPIRVPVVADCEGILRRAEIIGSTRNVLLLQGHPGMPLPALGTTIRLRVEWDRQNLSGRIAAHGVGGRYLVSIGERAIRRSRRFAVDVSGLVRSAHVDGTVEVRVRDLSAGGARIEGIDLPVGSDVNLHFTPPGRSAPLDVLGFVVRLIDTAEVPTVGVAFRLVQPSMDVLGGASVALA